MQQKKNIKIVILIISIIVILAGLAFAFYVINKDKNTPTDVLKQYMSYITEQKYEEMYLLLSEKSKADPTFSKETYLSRNKNIYEGIEIKNLKISDITTYEDDKTKVTYKTDMSTVAGDISFTNTATFTRQDDKKYYLNWDSTVIFPNLENDEKIRVTSSQGNRGKILDRNNVVLAETSNEGTRIYPYGKVTSHLLGYIRGVTAEELEESKGKGYTSNSLIGKAGMEKIFEDRLKGTNGTEIYVEDSNGEKKTTLAKTNIKDGENIKLTIDVKLQEKIFKEFDGDNGFSVAMNPKTGEILAMVSTPTYNSNDFIKGFSDKEWEKLSNNKNNPMYTRYQSTWVPGSSFKPITAAIGLSTGKMTANEDYGKSGLSWQNGNSWGSYKVTTLTGYSGPANLKNALIYSDNIYFAKSALKIGADTFAIELQKIGFNKEIPFEQNMSKSQFAEGDKFKSEIQLADSGYGQGKILINPIHMASIYSAFVNDGNMVTPYIEYKENTKPQYWVKNAFTKEATNTIKNDLIQVVENPNGTGHEAMISGMTIAGKTGTAEIKASQDDENGTELGWFNAFRVTDNPKEQLLTINMIQDVKNRGGSHYLLPKVRNIFK